MKSCLSLLSIHIYLTIMKILYFAAALSLTLATLSCGSGNKAGKSGEAATAESTVVVPTFDADSAYAYIRQQTDFGPRVPNTAAHRACGDFLAAQLERFGARVVSQHAQLVAYDGTRLEARNIIGSYNPESKKRIALFAHWDTRPWADNDPDAANRRKPVLGANDGGSGVGVLLEVARQLNLRPTTLGIDIIFFDAEDYGAHQEHTGEHRDDYWCLGSQHWSRTPHIEGYTARFGILLDIVGGRGSVFHKEGYSEDYAAGLNKKVWKAAAKLGYGHIFRSEKGTYVTDDHVFVNRLARIPTIDIIPFNPMGEFTDTWHTVNDDMEHIDPATLKAVGQTVMEVIYNEK